MRQLSTTLSHGSYSFPISTVHVNTIIKMKNIKQPTFLIP
jgi:hypothetical protein